MTLASRLAAHMVEYFGDVAPDYERWAGGLHAKAATRLVELIAPAAGEHCLDIGTGTGLVARALAGRLGAGAHIIGIEPSPRMLREARRRAPAGVVYMEMWAEELVFRDASFDLVAFGDSLAYLLDPFRALEEAHRVLRPGGRIGVSCKTRSLSTPAQDLSFAALLEMARDDGLVVPRQPEYHQSFGEPEVLTGLLEEYGFQAVETTQLVTGFRARNALEWIEMLSGLGPFAHSVISSMGPVRRARLAARLEPRMEPLGEDAWRIHHSFTLAVASRP